MDAPVTRRELHAALETWAGAIIRQVTKDVITQTKALLQVLKEDLFGELRSQISGSQKELEGRLVAIDEQYKDLPSRVSRLEAKVFGPATKRRRRAAR